MAIKFKGGAAVASETDRIKAIQEIAAKREEDRMHAIRNRSYGPWNDITDKARAKARKKNKMARKSRKRNRK